MVDKPRDNRTSDDLLADLDALEELLGPARQFSSAAAKGSPRDNPGPTHRPGPQQPPRTADRRDEALKEPASMARTDKPGAGTRPPSTDKPSADEQIPLLEDVVYPGVKEQPGGARLSPPELPTRAEIDSWVELAIETRLEPLKKQLRRELWEELLRRFPALRDRR